MPSLAIYHGTMTTAPKERLNLDGRQTAPDGWADVPRMFREPDCALPAPWAELFGHAPVHRVPRRSWRDLFAYRPTSKWEPRVRRALSTLRQQEESRYAAKDKELQQLAAAARVQDSRTAIGTAYFWVG